jgi:hypothetical protein
MLIFGGDREIGSFRMGKNQEFTLIYMNYISE